MQITANILHDRRRKWYASFYPDARKCFLKLRTPVLALRCGKPLPVSYPYKTTLLGTRCLTPLSSSPVNASPYTLVSVWRNRIPAMYKNIVKHRDKPYYDQSIFILKCYHQILTQATILMPDKRDRYLSLTIAVTSFPNLQRSFQKLTWSLWVHFVYGKVQPISMQTPPKSRLLPQVLIHVPFGGSGVQCLEFTNQRGP